jgi:predicted small lipoprotein YifL
MTMRCLKLLPLVLCLAGCGQTGPLYLPEKTAPPPPAPPPAEDEPAQQTQQ